MRLSEAFVPLPPPLPGNGGSGSAPVPTYFMNVKVETVLGACNLHRFNRN